jgi:ribosomal protein S6
VSDEHRKRRYETMIVLRTDLQEAGVKEQAERVRKLLETQGAIVGAIHEWGLRELATPFKRNAADTTSCGVHGAAAVGELANPGSDFVLRLSRSDRIRTRPATRRNETQLDLPSASADDDDDLALPDVASDVD